MTTKEISRVGAGDLESDTTTTELPRGRFMSTHDSNTTTGNLDEDRRDLPLDGNEHLQKALIEGTLEAARAGDDLIFGADSSPYWLEVRNLRMQREHLRGDLHIFREIDSVVSRLDVVLNLVFTGAGSTKTLGEVIGQTFGDLLPEQLQAIAKKMKHFVYEDHEAATALRNRVKTPSELSTEKPDWLVKPLLVDEGVSLLFGQKRSGKSLTATLAMLAAVSGTELGPLSTPDPKSRVLFVDFESGERSFRNRLDRLAYAAKIPDAIKESVHYLDVRGENLVALADQLKTVVVDDGYEAVVIDSVTSGCPDAIDMQTARQVIEGALSWNVPTLMIAHKAKIRKWQGRSVRSSGELSQDRRLRQPTSMRSRGRSSLDSGQTSPQTWAAPSRSRSSTYSTV